MSVIDFCGAATEDASRSGFAHGAGLRAIIGKAERFQCGKQIASYPGLVPLEESRANRLRLGHITKQGSSMPRFLLVEAPQVTVRSRRAFSAEPRPS
jgi:transposase